MDDTEERKQFALRFFVVGKFIIMLFNIIRQLLLCPCSGKIIDFSNADVAVDQYHRFEVKTII
jgi:hypothetical protein